MPQVNKLDTRNTICKNHFLEKKCAKKRHTGLWYMIVLSIQSLSGLIETMRNFHLNGPRGRHLLEARKGYESSIAI
jgi:hypothetical protein